MLNYAPFLFVRSCPVLEKLWRQGPHLPQYSSTFRTFHMQPLSCSQFCRIPLPAILLCTSAVTSTFVEEAMSVFLRLSESLLKMKLQNLPYQGSFHSTELSRKYGYDWITNLRRPSQVSGFRVTPLRTSLALLILGVIILCHDWRRTPSSTSLVTSSSDTESTSAD